MVVVVVVRWSLLNCNNQLHKVRSLPHHTGWAIRAPILFHLRAPNIHRHSCAIGIHRNTCTTSSEWLWSSLSMSSLYSWTATGSLLLLLVPLTAAAPLYACAIVYESSQYSCSLTLSTGVNLHNRIFRYPLPAAVLLLPESKAIAYK